MKYPTIARFHGHDELEILINEAELHSFIDSVQSECELIDSIGTIYNINRSTSNEFLMHQTNAMLTPREAVDIARKHIAALDHCCVAKFNADSVEQVIAALVAIEID